MPKLSINHVKRGRNSQGHHGLEGNLIEKNTSSNDIPSPVQSVRKMSFDYTILCINQLFFIKTIDHDDVKVRRSMRSNNYKTMLPDFGISRSLVGRRLLLYQYRPWVCHREEGRMLISVLAISYMNANILKATFRTLNLIDRLPFKMWFKSNSPRDILIAKMK